MLSDGTLASHEFAQDVAVTEHIHDVAVAEQSVDEPGDPLPSRSHSLIPLSEGDVAATIWLNCRASLPPSVAFSIGVDTVTCKGFGEATVSPPRKR